MLLNVPFVSPLTVLSEAPLVVMLTNLIEKNQVKADMYWPNRVGELRMFGRMRVKLVSQKTHGKSLYSIHLPI